MSHSQSRALTLVVTVTSPAFKIREINFHCSQVKDEATPPTWAWLHPIGSLSCQSGLILFTLMVVDEVKGGAGGGLGGPELKLRLLLLLQVPQEPPAEDH